ncbi:MAG TPA: T9SS type A sorting domain-containing protein, partial [Bacteroidetes bacterium]|nr:T9SS type A sorting domain-containing protein [Bacteroidota bacterium]
FEIVTSGTDPLTGLQKVKFGNKSLRINDTYGHLSTCQGDYGVDKIVKRFKVTKENRDFTVWYSVALENPSGHENRQPFLNIKCDLAPDNELCFDADIIQCAQYLDDPQCTFDSIDVLDWSCHRFKIPEDKIGQIATLEMIIGDCGLGAHFGYAYIDGICEECDSSALGSATLDEDIDYRSCDGLTARICGTYTPPTICSNGGNWAPSEVTVPGYDITNVTIDTASKTFCFDFPFSNFGNEDCLEIYAEIVFNNGVFDLPEVLTNSIDICKKLYTKSHNYTIEVGGCDEGSSSSLSDDYYMVRLNILAPETDSWILERHLVDPYSNESGSYTLMTGSGDAQLELGPFLIQEGDWWLEISFSDCEYNELIEDPGFCSGCDQFYGTEISNVHCNKEDDTWGYDIRVNWINAIPTDYFTIGSTKYSYNMTHSITVGAISDGCIVFNLVAASSSPTCSSELKICPPKPCSEECNLEAYVVDVICTPGSDNFIVQMDISGIGNKQLCSDPGNYYYYPYYNYYLSADTYIELKLCDYGVPCSTCTSNCYKTIFVPKPDCDYTGWEREENFKSPNSFTNKINTYDELTIFPNPVISDEIIISSKLENTDFKIFNTEGKLIEEGSFSGSEFRLKLDEIPGLYLIRYTNSQGKPTFVKMIKL